MNLSNSGKDPQKKWERILAGIYLCVFLLFAANLVLRTLGILPGGCPDWYMWPLTLLGLAALLSYYLSLPQPVNRILRILLAITVVLKLAEMTRG